MNHLLFLALAIATVVAILFFKFVPAKRRASVPILSWGLCVILGLVVAIVSLIHSTAPSLAPGTIAVGKAADCVELRNGPHFSKYAFQFQPQTGAPVRLETRILTPPVCRASSHALDPRTYRIVYLNDADRNPSNEAIDIEVLSGPDAGWHKALDARPFGLWWGVPFGFTLGFIGLGCIRLGKSDRRPRP